MFNKLLANLTFDPDAVSKLGLYGRLLKKDVLLRRVGFVFVAVALVVQIIAFASPATASSGSSNDIIYGGLDNRGTDPKSALLSVYDNNSDGHHTDYQGLFRAFGITRNDLANSSLGTINSGDHSLYSLGRDSHSNLDQPQTIDGQQYFLRPLYTWGDNLNYQAFIGQRSGVQGSPATKYFAVMVSCGNIVIKSVPQPQLTVPNKIARTDGGLPAANSTVVPGQTLGYRIYFNNIGQGSATNVQLIDHIPNDTTLTWFGTSAASNGGQQIGNQVIWDWNAMPAGASNWYSDMNVKVAATATNGELICNEAYLSSAESATLVSQQVCFTVVIPVKPTPPPPAPPPPPPTPGQPNIVKAKSAINLTQNLSDAQSKPANPGDEIKYQLNTINDGSATAKNYVISDSINYILQYADVLSISDNGKVANGIIDWPAVDINKNQSVIRTFIVKVKSPLPSNPSPSSDPNSYDLKLFNVYGTTVSINLPPPNVPKAIEQATTTLPNTGPGTSVGIAAAIASIVGFFYYRSRLISKEVAIIEKIIVSGEGY